MRNNEMSNYGPISITHQFLSIVKLDQWVIISLRIVKQLFIAYCKRQNSNERMCKMDRLVS